MATRRQQRRQDAIDYRAQALGIQVRQRRTRDAWIAAVIGALFLGLFLGLYLAGLDSSSAPHPQVTVTVTATP